MRTPTFALAATALIAIETVMCVSLLRAASGRPRSAGAQTRVAHLVNLRTVAVEWHVAPDGRSANPGTEAAPLDLATALSSAGPAIAGDTIWIHGGTYRGVFVSTLTGAPGRPIVVRQAPGERATLDGSGSPNDVLTVNGGWTWYWGIEITNSDPRRISSESGSWPGDLTRGAAVVARAPYVKFINLVVHDNAGGFSVWDEATDAEIYGSLIYYNGWNAPDRGHGHGIYTQNAAPSVRTVKDNVLFDQFSHGIHAYGSERAALDNIVLEGNVAFENGALAGDFARDLLLGGGRVARRPVMRDNFTYGPAPSNLGYAAGCDAAIVTGNYFGGPFTLSRCPAVVQRNTFVGPFEELGGDGRQHPLNVFADAPRRGTVVSVRPNRYEPGRGHVIVYNWARQPTVRVSLEAICARRDEPFELHNAQDFFAPAVADGSCREAIVDVPMNSLAPAAPIGQVATPPVNTAPEFAVLVVLPKASSSSAPTETAERPR